MKRPFGGSDLAGGPTRRPRYDNQHQQRNADGAGARSCGGEPTGMGRGVGTDVAPSDGIQNRTTRDGPTGLGQRNGISGQRGISGYSGFYGPE